MTDPTTTADRPEIDDPRVLALAKARQQIAYENPFNVVCPPWDGLSGQEQQLSLLDARNYLRAALKAGLVPAAAPAPHPADRAVVRSAALREGADAVAADTGFHIRYGAAVDYAEHYAALLRRLAGEAAPDNAETRRACACGQPGCEYCDADDDEAQQGEERARG